MHSLRKRITISAVAIAVLVMAACSGGSDSAVTPSSETGSSSTEEASSGAAAVGSPTDLDLDGMITLQYDSDYWQVELPTWEPEPGENDRHFVNPDSLAVVTVGYRERPADPLLSACDDGYTGDRDPSIHRADLLHEEMFANGARLRIYRLGDAFIEPEFVIDEAVVQFGMADDRQVGESSCLSYLDANDSLRMVDGKLIEYNITMYWTFAEGQWITPFQDEFDSAEEFQARSGYAEMLALVSSISLPGEPAS